ncbi:MAG: hypothetical protein IKC28_11580 [Clostridia bacterium]|nr:hypothetical protein [Clostridia bacterium]
MQQNPFQGMNPQQPWQQGGMMPPSGMPQGNMPPFGMQQPMAQPNPFGLQQDPMLMNSSMGQAPFMGQQPVMQPSFGMQNPMQPMPVTPQQWPPPGAQQAMTPEMMQQQMQYEAMQWQQAQQQPFPTQPVVHKQKKQKPPRPPKQPGQGGAGKTILIVLLILALIGAGVYFFFLRDPGTQVSTAQIELGLMGNTFRGDALIVRNETAYSEEGVQNIEYEAEEGSLVYRSDPLCYVYSTGYSTGEMNTLQDYRDQINDYQQTLLAAETAYDQRMDMLETEVIERGLEVRSLVQGSRGNLINQETILDTAITQRQNYFRSKYASDTRLSRLYDDENTQKQRIESWIKPKLAAQESIVSFYTDGFEQALSPELFETYTPSQVRSMIAGEKPQTSAAERGRIDLYRLVRKDNYAVLMLINDKNWNPAKDEVYELTLEQFTSTKVQAKVLSYARSGGELLVRLAVVDDVSNVLYMRTCEASISEAVECMTVPLAAIYTQNGSKGVVIYQNGVPSFVPVNVLNQAEGKVYIQPLQSGVLSEGMEVQLFN